MNNNINLIDLKTSRIRHLNDEFRTILSRRLGQVMLSYGVSNLPDNEKLEVISIVNTFSDFTEDNDPHKEHDFGNFSHNGQKYFFKIDYYDPTMAYHSEDAADPAKTVRVLTIMFASEY